MTTQSQNETGILPITIEEIMEILIWALISRLNKATIRLGLNN